MAIPRIRYLLACCASAALLAGCASSSGIKPSAALEQPAALASDKTLAGVPHSAAAWPTANWWTGLGDPRLGALIGEALRNNPDLDVALARARAADAATGTARAALLPTVSGSAGVAGAYLPATVIAPPSGGRFGWSKDAFANFKWDVDLWGGKRAAWEAAVGQAYAAEVDIHATRLAVSTSLARAYADLGYAFRQQELAHDELQRARRARDLTQQRFESGIDNRLNLKRSDAEVAQGERALAATGRAVDTARIALAKLLGKGPDRGLDIQRPTLLAPERLEVPAELPAELLGRRPDIVAARWRVEAAERGIAAAKTEFLPNVSLGALAGLVARGSTNLLQLPARFFQFGPTISLPLFEGGRLRANLQARDADYDLAVASYNRTLIAAINQVAEEVKARQSLARQIAAQRESLDAARAAWGLAQQRYQSGIGSFLEALDVRRDLLAAEQALAQLQADQVDQSIQLIAALGGGWHAAPAATPPSMTSTTAVQAHHE